MSETALFFALSRARLVARCRWAGGALALSLVLPFEVVDGRPQFLFQLFGELPPAAVAAALAPAAAGLVIVGASFLARRAASLAVAVVAALVTTAALLRLGADRAAWDLLPLPSSVTARPVSALLALAFAAAGASLAFRPHARKVSRAVLGASLASAAIFYLWPARGEAPAGSIVRALGALPSMPHWRLSLGLLILVLLAALPAMLSAWSAVHAFRPPAREQPIASVMAVFGLPAVLLMFVYRSLLGAAGGAHVLAAVGAILVLTGFVALVASSVEILGERLAAVEADLEEPPGLPLTRAAAAALAASSVLVAAQALLARPPDKGVEWTLAPASAAGDRLFGELLPAWSQSRLRWDRRVREQSSARAMVELKGAARELERAATALEPGVGRAFQELTRAADDLGGAGRRWYRLVGDVNEANRLAGLPYYADPSVSLRQGEAGIERRFRTDGYRIEKVRRFLVDGRPFATLRVRALGEARQDHLPLGFSRDLQPFALVVLDEIEPYDEKLSELARAVPPRCGDGAEPEAAAALLRCGEVLRDVVGASPGALAEALVASTERHELQHQVDGPHLPLSRAVLEKMAAYAEPAQDRVNRELSAYVAEMTAPGVAPRLGLVHLARFALLSSRGTEHHVAVLALEALAERRLRTSRGAVDPTAFAAALTELAALGDDALRERSARAWGHLFGTQLPEPLALDPD